MDTQKAEKALQIIAAREGISVAEVRREIELVLREIEKNPDPKAQAIWNTIPCKGAKPTPEEVVAHIAGIVTEQ